MRRIFSFFIAFSLLVAPAYAQPAQSDLATFRAFPLADKGYKLIGQNRYEEAIPFFERALVITPKNQDYRAQLVNLLILQGQYDRARAQTEIGLDYMPGNATLLGLQQQIDAQVKADEPVIATAETAPVAAVPAAAAEEKTGIAAMLPDYCTVLRMMPALTAAQHMDEGYCELNAGKRAAAIQHFEAAATADAEVSLQAYRQLGYLYAQDNAHAKAAKAWRQVYRRTREPEAGVQLVRSLRLSGLQEQAAQVFDALPVDAMNADLQLQYANEGSALATVMGDNKRALAMGSKALKISGAADQHYYQALRLQKAGQDEAAVTELEQAQKTAPDNRLYAVTLAYAYRNVNEDAKSLPHFDYAVEDEQYHEAREDYGYALKEEGRRKRAAEQFGHVLGFTKDEEKYYNLKRDIQQLEDEWQTVGSVTYRDGIARGVGIPGIQNYEDSFQYGFETVYGPERWQRHGRRVQLYGQLFTGSDAGEFNFNEDSTQGALGIRATPLPETEWYVYAARLIGVGEDALYDWQLRTTYAYTEGFDIEPNLGSWQYAFLTPDISYIVDRSELFATVEGRYGRSYRSGAHWVTTPHLVGAAAHQKNPDSSTDSVELGAGVSFKYWFAATDKRAPRGSAEAILQWREPVGSSEDRGGPYLRFVVQY